MPTYVSDQRETSNTGSATPQKRSHMDAYEDNEAGGRRCYPCQRDFTTRRSYLRHLRESQRHRGDATRDEDNHECSICGRVFARAWDRDRHQREQHEDGKDTCSTCGRRVRRNTPHKNKDGVQCYPPLSGPTMNVQDLGRLVNNATDATNSTQHTSDNCDGMCFLSIASEASDKDRFPSLCMKAYSCHVRAANAKRPMHCGLCGDVFELHNVKALFGHLQDHFRQLKDKHSCEICEIGFTHRADLERHQASAADGDCGFHFQHKQPCTGHHPPGHILGTNMFGNDDDRFNFYFRVATWEQLQLRSFKESVDSIKDGLKMYPKQHLSDPNRCSGCSECDRFNKDGRYAGASQSCCQHCQNTGHAGDLRDSRDTYKTSRTVQCSTRFLDGPFDGQLRYHRASSVSESSRDYSDMRNLGGTSSEPKPRHCTTRSVKRLGKWQGSVSLEDRQHLLHRSIGTGDTEHARLALANGADPRRPNRSGNTALHFAIRCDAADIISELIQHGVTPSLYSLAQASFYKSFKAFELLGKHRLVESADPQRVSTEVAIAAFMNEWRYFMHLIDHASSIDADSLSLAIYFDGGIEYVKVLVERVSDLDYALYVARRRDREDVVELLTARGAQMKDISQSERKLRAALKSWENTLKMDRQ